MAAKSRFDVNGLTSPNADSAYAPQPVSDSASLQASFQKSPPPPKSDGSDTIRLSDLAAGRPDPEADLVTLTVRVPRYLDQALTMQSRITGRPKQQIMRDCLLATLQSQHVSAALSKQT